MAPTTCIIGAGISGLQTCKELLQLGHHVVVLERQAEVGGVWSKNYVSYGVQVPKEFFEIPGYPPAPELGVEDYPTGPKLRDYICAFAHEHDLYSHIVFGATVTRVHRLSGHWQCYYVLASTRQQHRMSADYMVICTGLHSVPYTPAIDNMQAFRGRILHVRDFNSADEAAGLHVLVVGGSKSAVDTAVMAAQAGAASVTVLFKQAHWPVSRYPMGRMHFTKIFHARLGAWMLDPYYNASTWDKVKGWITRPVRRAFWRKMERSVVAQFGLSGHLLPAMSLQQDMLSGGMIHDGRWAAMLQDGTILAVKGEAARFERDGVILRSGEFLGAELVLLAAGHRKDYSFLDPDIVSKLSVHKDGMYLYRHMLPPLVKNLAFVGSEANSANNLLTSGLQAAWLAACMAGRIKLPPPAAMLRDLQAQMRWQREMLPPQTDRACMVGIYCHHYHDQLMKDMHVNCRRKPNPWSECFEPYCAADYEPVLDRLHKEISVAASGSGELVERAHTLGYNMSRNASMMPTDQNGARLGNGQHAGSGQLATQGSLVPPASSATSGAGGAPGPDALLDSSASTRRTLPATGTGMASAPASVVNVAGGCGTRGSNRPGSSSSVAVELDPSRDVSYTSYSTAGAPLSVGGGTLRGGALHTLYEQESTGHGHGQGPAWAGAAAAAVAAEAGPAPHMHAHPPVAAGPSFVVGGMPGRPAAGAFLAPASGRSCLMDAADLGMIDGVVGAAKKVQEVAAEKPAEGAAKVVAEANGHHPVASPASPTKPGEPSHQPRRQQQQADKSLPVGGSSGSSHSNGAAAASKAPSAAADAEIEAAAATAASPAAGATVPAADDAGPQAPAAQQQPQQAEAAAASAAASSSNHAGVAAADSTSSRAALVRQASNLSEPPPAAASRLARATTSESPLPAQPPPLAAGLASPGLGAIANGHHAANSEATGSAGGASPAPPSGAASGPASSTAHPKPHVSKLQPGAALLHSVRTHLASSGGGAHSGAGMLPVQRSCSGSTVTPISAVARSAMLSFVDAHSESDPDFIGTPPSCFTGASETDGGGGGGGRAGARLGSALGALQTHSDLDVDDAGMYAEEDDDDEGESPLQRADSSLFMMDGLGASRVLRANHQEAGGGGRHGRPSSSLIPGATGENDVRRANTDGTGGPGSGDMVDADGSLSVNGSRTGTATGYGGGAPAVASDAAALERYASRLTTGATFRMSMGTFSDLSAVRMSAPSNIVGDAGGAGTGGGERLVGGWNLPFTSYMAANATVGGEGGLQGGGHHHHHHHGHHHHQHTPSGATGPIAPLYLPGDPSTPTGTSGATFHSSRLFRAGRRASAELGTGRQAAEQALSVAAANRQADTALGAEGAVSGGDSSSAAMSSPHQLAAPEGIALLPADEEGSEEESGQEGRSGAAAVASHLRVVVSRPAGVQTIAEGSEPESSATRESSATVATPSCQPLQQPPGGVPAAPAAVYAANGAAHSSPLHMLSGVLSSHASHASAASGGGWDSMFKQLSHAVVGPHMPKADREREKAERERAEMLAAGLGLPSARASLQVGGADQRPASRRSLALTLGGKGGPGRLHGDDLHSVGLVQREFAAPPSPGAAASLSGLSALRSPRGSGLPPGAGRESSTNSVFGGGAAAAAVAASGGVGNGGGGLDSPSGIMRSTSIHVQNGPDMSPLHRHHAAAQAVAAMRREGASATRSAMMAVVAAAKLRRSSMASLTSSTDQQPHGHSHGHGHVQAHAHGHAHSARSHTQVHRHNRHGPTTSASSESAEGAAAAGSGGARAAATPPQTAAVAAAAAAAAHCPLPPQALQTQPSLANSVSFAEAAADASGGPPDGGAPSPVVGWAGSERGA